MTPNVERDLFKKYGFKITFPATWKNYRMIEGVYSSHSSIYFIFKQYDVMQIVMYTPEQYSQFIAKYHPSKTQYFDYENSKYFYKFEYGPGCAQLSNFECQRTEEVPAILKTFKFIR